MTAGYLYQSLLDVRRETDGNILITDGMLALDYERAVELRQWLGEYISRGKEVTDAMFNADYDAVFEPSRSSAKSQPIPQPGFIYLIKGVQGHYKIGRSKTPETRLTKLEVKLPFPVDVLHLITTDDMHRAEDELHERFSVKRVNGEWFALDDHDVRYITSLVSMIYAEVQL